MRRSYITALSYGLIYLAAGLAVNGNQVLALTVFLISGTLMIIVSSGHRISGNAPFQLVMAAAEMLTLLLWNRHYDSYMLLHAGVLIINCFIFTLTVSTFKRKIQLRLLKTAGVMTLSLTALLAIIDIVLRIITKGTGVIASYWLIPLLLAENLLSVAAGYLKHCGSLKRIVPDSEIAV